MDAQAGSKMQIEMKTLKYIFIAIVLAAAQNLSAQDLIILHTNDTHSQIEPFDSGVHKGLAGIERREKYINSVRQANPGKVLYLDAGDFSQGTPYFTLFKGETEGAAMKAMGVDVACLGNHEFDNGQQALAERIKKLPFPIVCANYNFDKTPLRGLVKPYVILEKNGHKIGVIGLSVYLQGLISPKNHAGMKYYHPYKIVKKYVKQLKKEGCDLIILLTHCGFVGGKEQSPDDQLIAANTEGADIIIGGHSHTFIKEPSIVTNKAGKPVVVVQAGEKGCEVGRFDITF